MIIRYSLLGLVSVLGGCASLPDWLALPAQSPVVASDSGAVVYHFDWELSGDKQVAPLQLFDNSRLTWLQFPHDQAVPAIFREVPGGHQPVSFERQGPYVVLPGVWPVLSFRGGHLTAVARRQPNANDTLSVDLVTDPVSNENLAASEIPEPSPEHASSQDSDQDAAQAIAVAVPGLASAVFSVSPSDQNLRTALVRWAQLAQWTFGAEQWSVQVDIPIAAAANFSSDFVPSVQSLVAATELSDHPLQPCFYANRVLRVVPFAQPCDRTATVLQETRS